jgi:hypothetical protein
MGKFPIRKNEKEIEFETVSGEITTEKEKLKKIFNTKNKLGTTLNFYR